jgi:L-lactate dehydrogenase complex protein LldG
MSAREEILERIRKANARASSSVAAQSAWDALPRTYNSVSRADREAVMLLLEDRLRDYDATVLQCGSEDVPGAVARILAERGKRRMVVPPGVPSAWLPQGFEFIVDEEFTAQQLDEFEGVLTCASLAIAETGTVVLQSVAGQGRRALSLVPDYHLCVVQAADVVATVPEAFARLQATAHLATTFISGPSATADIEMTRIKGVHGPRVLDVLFVA